MSLSDQVRDFFDRHYVVPARRRGESQTKVAVSDISRTFRWRNRFQLICCALVAPTFHEQLGVELLSVSHPAPSSTTVFTFCRGIDGLECRRAPGAAVQAETMHW